jgi:hypothetical protein
LGKRSEGRRSCETRFLLCVLASATNTDDGGNVVQVDGVTPAVPAGFYFDSFHPAQKKAAQVSLSGNVVPEEEDYVKPDYMGQGRTPPE